MAWSLIWIKNHAVKDLYCRFSSWRKDFEISLFTGIFKKKQTVVAELELFDTSSAVAELNHLDDVSEITEMKYLENNSKRSDADFGIRVANDGNSKGSLHSDRLNYQTLELTDYDELFEDAGRFVIEEDKASIGMLQRWFKIGFI